uniref:Uncharacterized protein n=1 Tax=Trichobilharzia regenti TaxID=157069 RepID=A0AA85J9L4_TRIRE|nr:unnamed protein product [Trichobilharzia regenti]CAH8862722.1 unnamed protein product [Trichobilharzia regenti]CAH8862726.1 unnamed protein product [Trichobilharzia regenti]
MIWHLLLAVLVISAVESARIKGNHSTTVDLLHHSSLQGDGKHSGLEYPLAVDKRGFVWRFWWVCLITPIFCGLTLTLEI